MLRRVLFMLSLFAAITGHAVGQSRPTNLKPGSVAANALAFFTQLETHSLAEYLKRVRLPKVSDELKAQVLTHVTRGKRIGLSDKLQAKLTALTPVLRYHERAAVLEICVVNLKQLSVGLQGRAVLLISELALQQLSEEQLQAVVAHELGHEYFWVELMEARQQKNHALIREIELRCDGIAVITLQQLGLDPANLMTALAKMRIFNERLVPTDPLYHPTPDERERFIRALAEWLQSKQARHAVNN
jgi:hypothetical protein